MLYKIKVVQSCQNKKWNKYWKSFYTTGWFVIIYIIYKIKKIYKKYKKIFKLYRTIKYKINI